MKLLRNSARSHFLLLCSAICITLAPCAIAQKPQAPIVVNLGPSDVAVHWTLGTTLHVVHGTFKLKNGSFRIDPATGNASGLIVIDATSGESGDDSRDKRMHNAVLESAKYPEITFRPTHIDGRIDLSTAGSVTVHGIFNLHGQDHPLDLTVNLHPQGSGVALATHFSVPFVAWGLKDPSTFVFRTDKEVALDLDGTIAPGR